MQRRAAIDLSIIVAKPFVDTVKLARPHLR
jgi:hypothetical protein